MEAGVRMSKCVKVYDENNKAHEIEVKPCPCCGETDELGICTPGNWYKPTIIVWFVCCYKCGMNNFSFPGKVENAEPWGAPHYSALAAVQAWNRRAYEQPKQLELFEEESR